MLTLDGSQGEGGGQVLRTALALALVTGTPFRIVNIRARRPRPGLARQHLTAVQAAAKVGRAEVEGAAIGSQTLVFRPGRVEASDEHPEPSGATPGAHHFSVGTAGSTTLILQTVLPALMVSAGQAGASEQFDAQDTHRLLAGATQPGLHRLETGATGARGNTIVLEGGTHNPLAPPFEFLSRAFLPLLARMGPRVTAVLERPGFYPAGGGRCTFRIEPVEKLEPIEIMQRGEIRGRRATAIISRLPRHVAERELRVVKETLGWGDESLSIYEVSEPRGPGNAVLIEIESEHVTEVFTGFGAKGKPAEVVAREAAEEAQRYLAAAVPVGEHLADQLLLPMALAGGGAFVTLPLSLHATTNIDVIRRFLDVRIEVEPADGSSVRVRINPYQRPGTDIV